jgi:hypothetical protein
VSHQLHLSAIDNIQARKLILEPMAEAIEALAWIGDKSAVAEVPVHDRRRLHVLASTLDPAAPTRQLPTGLQ